MAGNDKRTEISSRSGLLSRLIRSPVLLIKGVWFVLKHRVGVTLPGSWDPTLVRTLLDALDGSNTVAIVGKGGSYLQVPNAKEYLGKSDYKILLNSFDPEVVSEYLGDQFDAQATLICSYFAHINPVASKTMLEKFGIHTLIVNATSENCARYFRMFRKRVEQIVCFPTREEILGKAPWLESIRQEEYNEGRVTLGGSIFHVVASAPTVNRIILLGVDGYQFDYHYAGKHQAGSSSYYNSVSESPSDDPRITHGKPCFEYIFDSLRRVQEVRSLELCLPRLLKECIDYPRDVKITWF